MKGTSIHPAHEGKEVHTLVSTVNFQNTMDNEKLIKASELGEKLAIHKESRIRLALNFSTATLEAKMKQNFPNSKEENFH